MATWQSRGLRGSTLEELLNRTNEQYQEKHLALVQKIPTPITPINFDKESRHITLAYFDQKSTVDYIGAVQGIPVCFDAKESKTDTFSLQNVHEHQVRFMDAFERQGGISFLGRKPGTGRRPEDESRFPSVKSIPGTGSGRTGMGSCFRILTPFSSIWTGGRRPASLDSRKEP